MFVFARSLATGLITIVLLAFLAACPTCGQITCTEDAACGSGGVCGPEGICVAEGDAGPGGEPSCDVTALASGTDDLVITAAVLTLDPFDTAGCIGFVGEPYMITLAVEGNIEVDFSGDELLISDAGVEPYFCGVLSAFEADSPTCDGDVTCFLRCATCFEARPEDVAVQLLGDDEAPTSVATCVDVTSGLVDDDCDGLPNVEEAVIGSLENEADSDGDGLLDGVELGIVFCDDPSCGCTEDADPTTTTYLLEADTDGDGFADGAEDANHNGAVDGGESDPGVPP